MDGEIDFGDMHFNPQLSLFITTVFFMFLIFICFGSIMDWPTVKEVIKRPVRLVICLLGKILIMPFISYGLGEMIYPESMVMRVGMFWTGMCPGLGDATIWTLLLDGNLNLSLVMTYISILVAIVFVPLRAQFHKILYSDWRELRCGIYGAILVNLGVLIVALAIGYCVQKKMLRLSNFIITILKGFSVTVLLYMYIFNMFARLIYNYLNLFWDTDIMLAGMGIPWLGFLIGYVLARICQQPHRDALAISIHTGVLDNYMAAPMVHCFRHGDYRMVPIAVAAMTPIPLAIIFTFQNMKANAASSTEICTRKFLKKTSHQYIRNTRARHLNH